MKPSVFDIYQEFVWNGANQELAEKLYDSPPITLDAVADRAPALLNAYKDTLWHIPERNTILQETLMEVNRDLGALTPKVVENINNLSDGAVESAHQTVVMGGPAYILNKAITAVRVASLSTDRGIPLTPFFCVADYDIVQTELTNIRTPIMGSNGNLVSIPVPEGYENSPVSVIPLPGHDWLNQIEDDLRSSYRPIFKVIEGNSRLLFEERLEQAITSVRQSFLSTSTLGEWSQRIMAHLFNVVGNLGIPLVPASHKKIRELLVEGMEFLLARDNRDRFLKTHGEITDLIESSGYSTGIGRRDPDYVPFFYECPEPGCNSSRTELHYEERGSTAILRGKCPTCSQPVEIETSADSPFLGEIASLISPRVDSRQMLVDTIIPTVAHVGGPGEAAYYAQIIPSVAAMSIPFPLFVKYPRIYFNTPWNEALAKSLEKEGIEVLHRGDMFSIMGKASRFRKKQQDDKMNEKLEELGRLILDTHAKLQKSLDDVSEKISTSSAEEQEKLQFVKLDLERYLSWTFGEFAENKLGQESSWSWIEWAINSGFVDLFGPYERAYVGSMKNGATVFVNFSI
ncbi:MAG: bacillithiol biosynthesis BshC [Candidatus Thorarchaeota archaeon]